MSRLRNRHGVLGLGGALALILTEFAHAQYQMISPVLYEGPRIALQGHANASSGDQSASSKEPASTPVTSLGNVANLQFAVSPARRRANLAQFVAKSRAADPSGATAIEEVAADSDRIFGEITAQMHARGLRIDNVADAYTVYWTTAWQAAHGDNSDLGQGTVQAVKRQAASALTATRELQSATDAVKQEFAEALLVQSLLIAGAVEQNKGNDAKLRQIGDAVRKGAKASGLDLDAMTLTETGFKPAEKTGAAAPTPAVPRADNPPYVLMAAAGGAGLGGAYLLGRMIGKRG